MPFSDQVERSVIDLAIKTGNAALNAIFPEEFETYLISLELCNWDNKMLDYLLFPVNPTSLSIIEPVSTNIIKTFGAVAVIKTDDFIPQTVTLTGNFGRSFKFIGVKENFSFFGITRGTETTTGDIQFNTHIKTGFGVMKVLQRICKRSRDVDTDERKPRRLYLHNYMFSESYWAEVRDVRFSQSMDTNMIWGYELELDILQKLNYRKEIKENGLANKLIKDTLAKSGNNIFQQIKRTASKEVFRVIR